MERKPKPTGYIEPMPKRQFLRLMKDFKELGGIYKADIESEMFLDIQGAEASALNANTILFRRKPSRSAVYEELYHVQQFREGKIDGTIMNTYICEIEVKKYLLENSIQLELTNEEIKQTGIALKKYEELLKKQKGDNNHDNL